MGRPKQGKSFIGKMAASLNNRVRKAMSRTSLLGSDPVSSIPEDVEVKQGKNEKKRARLQQQKAKGAEPGSLAKAIMTRNADCYGVYTFEFESVDAEDMLRNGIGNLLSKVQCQTINRQP